MSSAIDHAALPMPLRVFLSHDFRAVRVPVRTSGALSALAADLAARAVWYFGSSGSREKMRAFGSDGGLGTLLYRLSEAADRAGWGATAQVFAKLNSVLNGCIIGKGARFGGGLVLLHPVGVVINSSVVGGKNVIIESGVTIGAEKGRSPRLGDHVFVGSGAKIIGPVAVGDYARIGANAVVVKDIAAYATAVGVPAREVKRGANGGTGVLETRAR